MRAWFIIAAAAAQVLVLAWMGGEREWVRWTGKTVWLRTAPVDPRDVFRGDYVRLSYEISQPSGELLRDGLKDPKETPQDAVVYAALDVDESGLAELRHVTDRKPPEGAFIRGRVLSRGPWEGLQVRYGIEALFLEQGKGLEIERGRGQAGIQVPLEVEAAVGPSGLAVIKGYRSCPLGLGIEIERQQMLLPPGGQRPREFKVKVRLQNASEKPLAVVDLPGHRSIRLKPIRGGEGKWRPVRDDEPPPAPSDEHVLVLEPEKIHTIALDLNEPAWAVRDKEGKVHVLGDLEWSDWFRLVYAPPPARDCERLKDAALIWHGRLSSRAFNPRFAVD